MKDLVPDSTVPAGILHIAPENPRSNETVAPDQINVLAENIRSQGVLTPLIGYMEDDVFHAVAGGRRTRAILQLVENATISDDYAVPVSIIEKNRALEVGIAEQVTHQKLSDIDELRIYAHDGFSDRTDKELAAIIGKSEVAVRQRRAVLSLPQHVLDAVFAGEITVDQAHGLTYFIGDDDTINDLLDDCKHNKNLSLTRLRDIFNRQTGEWSKSPLTQLVTQDEYKSAGGELQEDLFSDEAFILTPHILRDLAREKALAQITQDYADWGFISERTDNGFPRRHPGCDSLTDEERTEWDEIRFQSWRHDEDEEPEWFERFHHLETKAKTFYPEDLKALLGVQWELQTHSTNNPFFIVEGVLPDDLEPLYQAGWLERPEPTPEAKNSAEQEDALPAALLADIQRLKLHAARQELIKKPNDVIQIYLQHVNTDYSLSFTTSPQPSDQPPAVEVSWSKQFCDAMELDRTHPDDMPNLSPADQRKLLALKMLKNMTVRWPGIERYAEKFRDYFTPDADFLKRYKKTLLVDMCENALGQDARSLQSQKVGALASMLADHAQADPHWLPIGVVPDNIE